MIVHLINLHVLVAMLVDMKYADKLIAALVVRQCNYTLQFAMLVSAIDHKCSVAEPI